MNLASISININNDKPDVPFMFRNNSKGDKGVIKQIFIRKDYDLGRLKRASDIQNEYQRILSSGRDPLIIDCGANIGASAVAFGLNFPEAKIHAIEPESNNFEILSINCQQFSNIQIMQAAISCEEETLYIRDPGEGDWGFQTTSQGTDSDRAVSAIPIQSILEQYPKSDPFIVKIDIEGGEARLFEKNIDWINLPILIIIELHDWLLPSTANSNNFLRAIAQYNRDFIYIGENIFSIRN